MELVLLEVEFDWLTGCGQNTSQRKATLIKPFPEKVRFIFRDSKN